MSSARASFSGRKVPGTNVLSLQTSNIYKRKPRLRRPVTACDECRAAKVKCNGRYPCSRCLTRNSTCTQSDRNNGVGARVAQQSTAAGGLDVEDAASTLNDTWLNEHLDLGGVNYESAAVLTEIDFAVPDLDFTTMPLPSTETEQRAPLESGNSDLNIMADALDEPLVTHSFPDQVSGMGAGCGTYSTNLFPCDCRSGLMDCIPRLESYIHDETSPPLDNLCHLVEDVVNKSQTAVKCSKCETRPADLVSIMSVFQQTAACFDLIRRAGMEGDLKMAIGNYEFPSVDDNMFKRMLILNLVEKAKILLNSVDHAIHAMCKLQPTAVSGRLKRSPVCLEQANLDYVSGVVAAFQKYFGMVSMEFRNKQE